MGNFISGQRKQQAIQESISEQEIQKYSHIKAIAINSPQNFTLDDAKYNCIETINFHLAFRNLNDEEIIHISNLLYILPQTLRVANFMLQSNKVSEKGWSCFFSNIKYLSSLSQLSLSLNNSDSLNIKPSNFKTLGKSLPKSLTLIYLNLNTIQISLKCIEELLKEATQKPNLNSVRLLANQLIEDYNGYFFEKFHTWFSKSNVSVIDFYLSFQTINDYDVATSFEQFFANIPNHLQMIKLQIRINLTATAYLSITQIINKLMKKINGKKLEILQLEIFLKIKQPAQIIYCQHQIPLTQVTSSYFPSLGVSLVKIQNYKFQILATLNFKKVIFLKLLQAHVQAFIMKIYLNFIIYQTNKKLYKCFKQLSIQNQFSQLSLVILKVFK